MLKVDNIITPSPEQMLFVIQGMRNPLNSWGKSDSEIEYDRHISKLKLGKNDRELMCKLCKAGPEHRKFMRQMHIGMRITAPLYWWKEFETYRVGVAPNPIDISINSCSTMHKITAKEFNTDDFSHEHLDIQADMLLGDIIYALNQYRAMYVNYNPEECSMDKKDIWWQMIQLLPSSYNQTRNVEITYEAGANMLRQRHGHKLDEWDDLACVLAEQDYSTFMYMAAGLL